MPRRNCHMSCSDRVSAIPTCSCASGKYRRAHREHSSHMLLTQRPSSALCRLLQGPGQGPQKLLSTPQDRAKARQMIGVHLTIEEMKLPGLEALHEVDKGDFRGVRTPGEHRFTKKGRAKGDA